MERTCKHETESERNGARKGRKKGGGSEEGTSVLISQRNADTHGGLKGFHGYERERKWEIER